MMQYIQKLLNKMKATEKGQGMVEYALIIAFVAAIAIFVLNNGLRNAVSSAFTRATEAVNSAGNVSTGGSGGTQQQQQNPNPGQ